MCTVRAIELRVSAALRAVHRWCLSGTPLQNSLKDMYALLHFLRSPAAGDSLARFQERTSNCTDPAPLQPTLQALMLRRRKRDTFGGRPLLPLPARRVEVLRAPLSEAEAAVYGALEQQARSAFTRLMRRGAVQANYLHVLALLTRLRQACDSPALVTKALEAFDAAAAADEATRGEPTPEARAKAEAMVAEGATLEECPICIETVSLDGGCVTACGHAFCTECIAEHMHRAAAVADEADARCPLCRRPLTPSRLFPLRQLLPEAATLPDESPVAAAAAGGAGPSEGDDGAPVGSTKTRLALQVVREMLSADADAKCLIFSCFTKFLDLVERALTAEGVQCARVDGSQRMKERERQLEAFHGRGVPVLLLSLKCGVGLNLTAANTVVLCEPWWNPFVEEQAIDRVHRIGQTRDVRVVRLATQHATGETIEDRVLRLQETKRAMAESAIGDELGSDASGQRRRSAAARLSDRDLRQLFG